MSNRTLDTAAGQAHDIGDGRQQRALAGAVCSDDGSEAARCELAADLLESGSPPVSYDDVAQHDPASDRLGPSA